MSRTQSLLRDDDNPGCHDALADLLRRWAEAIARRDWALAKRIQVELRADHKVSILLMGAR